MIVAMQEKATEEQIDAVIGMIVESGLNVHRTTGASQTILAGVGNTGVIDLTKSNRTATPTRCRPRWDECEECSSRIPLAAAAAPSTSGPRPLTCRIDPASRTYTVFASTGSTEIDWIWTRGPRLSRKAAATLCRNPSFSKASQQRFLHSHARVVGIDRQSSDRTRERRAAAGNDDRLRSNKSPLEGIHRRAGRSGGRGGSAEQGLHLVNVRGGVLSLLEPRLASPLVLGRLPRSGVPGIFVLVPIVVLIDILVVDFPVAERCGRLGKDIVMGTGCRYQHRRRQQSQIQ